jgi:non-specific protein-tyrosine kinase
VVGLTLIGAIVAFLATGTQKFVYEATGRLLVLGQVQASALSVSSDQIINTDAALLTQAPLLRKVIDQLHLGGSPEQLAARIQVIPEPTTELIDVKVRDGSPVLAGAIANAVMNVFIANGASDTAAVSDSARTRLKDQQARAQQQLSSDQAALEAAQRARRDTTGLRTTVDNDTAQLTQLTDRVTALDTQKQQASNAIVIASPAAAPASPVGPGRSSMAAVGAFAGVLLGLSLAVLLEYLDQGLRTEDDVRERLNLPTLGVIPRSWSPSSANHGGKGDAAAESYRRLRTNVLFSSVDTPLKSIVITSARPGEGKTRTAANLAGIMAAAGERVLLVDADMRRPNQHRLFDQPMQAGVSELLLQSAHVREPQLTGKHNTRFANLWLLTAGTPPPNPSELLASKHTARVLTMLEEQYDLVVLDTPPAQLVTDALSLAAKASGTIVVVEAGKTNARLAEQTITALRNVGANVVGVVINKARRHRSAGYYYSSNQAADANGAGLAADEVRRTKVWLPLGNSQAAVKAAARPAERSLAAKRS